MKILYIITSLRTGGAEHLMVDLLPRLQQHGHEVALFLMDGTKTPFMEQLQAYPIPMFISAVGGNVYDPRHIWRLRNIMRNYDIVHTHNTSPQLFAAIANIGIRKTLISTEHSTFNRRRKFPILKPIDRWMYRQYNHVICISDQAKKNLRTYLSLPEISISTIFNGIDTTRFAEAKASTSLQNALPTNAKICMMVSAFREQKDQPTLLRAMALLPNEYHLVLVGGGDEMLQKNCKELSKQLNITNRTHFLGIRTDIPELLKVADVLILSSHYEGLSLSNLEAMAAGKPFIASDVDGLREVVDGYGLLFPEGDAHTLAKQIKELGENKAYAKEIATRCQRKAMEFDISKMVKEYSTIYEKFL